MIEVVDRQFRRLRRLARFAAVVANAWLDVRRYRDGNPDPKLRALCLHHWSRAVLRALDVRVEMRGRIPEDGLLVSNHLSYLDILVYSAAVPCSFVSKSEVAHWPIIGLFARFSGTIFVRRNQRGNSARANQRIAAYLAEGVPVVLFPEGTTTDGQHVLRFHSSMLQPAVDATQTVTPCAIGYELPDGDPATEICWWGKMTLTPHVWNLFGKREIRAEVMFGEPIRGVGNRKALSNAARQRVVAMHEALSGKSLPATAIELTHRH
jgi:1-acyl-sn-glycerol-3-phosphate acyltransferase